MVDGAEASSLTVFSDHRFVRCAAAHEVGSVVVGLKSLSGSPPVLISTACFDPLRDEGGRYAAALRAAGTPVDVRSLGSLTHGFASLFPLGGGGAVTTTELGSALRAHLSRV
jgi:acetyl esterase/lipase